MRVESAVVGFLLVFGIVAAGVPQSSAAYGDTTRAARGKGDVYLALGDSLAAGYQPGRGDTAAGYVNDLWAILAERIEGLGLRNVGCSGETSRSMITGDGSPCHYAAGSQLDKAVAFIERHAGRIAFITVDIGTNDVFERCLRQTGLLERSCVARVVPRVQTRLMRIFDALRTAAGSGVPIISMTYFDPLLGLWVIPGGRALARASLRSFKAMNARFATTYEASGVGVADVAGTFQIDNSSDTAVVQGREIPLNVALTCRWTWFCAKRFFGDPHPNEIGHQKIAHTFSRELRPLLPRS